MESVSHWGDSPSTPVEGLGRPVVARKAGSRAASDPVSMAMHLHASFSEQTASYEAHLSEASRLGVDVLWWTDHDFRVSAYGYRQGVRFDGPVESEGHPAISWTWVEEWEGAVREGGGDFVSWPRSPHEPGGALRIRALADDHGEGTVWFRGNAWNMRYSTSLADTTVELDVLGESLGEDAVLLVEVQSSYHPASGGRPAGKYRLEYRIGHVSRTKRCTEGNGLIGVVERPLRGDAWHRLVLRPVDDIAKLWPDLVAMDNSLHKLRLGVRSANGAEARAVVDRLRFRRRERQRGAGLELRRRVLDAYAERFTDVRHYEALEVSLTRHLNWFGGDLKVPNYGDGPPFRSWDIDRARSMVEFMHEHGALASFNHPMGVSYDEKTPVDLSRLIVETGALGADLVEIGHREDIERLLHVFDVAARNTVFFTGTGVSDDHFAEDWLGQEFNYLTHVWSPSVELGDLMDGLRRGHAWFADPGEWRGALDTEIGDVAGMGRVVRSADRLPIRVTATDLPSDATLEVVSGVVDRPGVKSLEPATSTVTVPASDVHAGSYELDLAAGPEGSYVRAQVRNGTGTVVAVGNPTWLLPEAFDGDIPAARLVEP
ncbi:MAG: hypothetical protein ACRDMV_09610 [Streptosporangiales bacterium]